MISPKGKVSHTYSPKFKDAFNESLAAYINGGCLTRSDLLFSFVCPDIPLSRNAPILIEHFRHFSSDLSDISSRQLNVRVGLYHGTNQHVLKMMTYLTKYLKNDLVGAYVHGSLGTYEETSYSDFDALVILKDEVFESPKRLARVARCLSDARSIMFDFDPLQHHGWFVLTECDLKFYSNAYFSTVLFQHAKSLLADKGTKLELSLRDSVQDNRRTFENTVNAIIRKLQEKTYLANMYQLKSLLSNFMLLPSLYVQVRDGQGVFKRESFDLAKADFSDTEWAIMKAVSAIRKNWHYEVSGFNKWILTRPHWLRHYCARNFAPGIPQRIRQVLTPEFYAEMARLAFLMKEKTNV